MEATVKYVSKSGKSVLAEVTEVGGDIVVRKSGFLQLAKPGSKKVGDQLKLPWDKVQEVKREVLDDETGTITQFTWLAEA